MGKWESGRVWSLYNISLVGFFDLEFGGFVFLKLRFFILKIVFKVKFLGFLVRFD